jgi:uncharacterized protein YdbL (DUF1318 family)
MVRKVSVLIAAIFIAAGCARVQVIAPKEPIKVDIAMRLDVYQHVEKDIDAIEEIVSGKRAAGKLQSMLNSFTGIAYADEGLSVDVEAAAMRRSARYGELVSAESSGRIGENKSGLAELRGAGKSDAALSELVSAENSDRMIIYKSVAKKNGATFDEVSKLYAKKLQSKAPSGTPVESASGNWEIR